MLTVVEQRHCRAERGHSREQMQRVNATLYIPWLFAQGIEGIVPLLVLWLCAKNNDRNVSMLIQTEIQAVHRQSAGMFVFQQTESNATC
jgi:hypothetical protein